MNRVKEDKLSELAVLFERYHIKMYNFFLKLTFDKTASHDLTQNLFYRILRYRKTYKDNNSFKSWVYQMARNVHSDYYKQQKKTHDRFQYVEHYNDSHATPDEPYTEDDFERLDKALSLLKPDQQEILILSRYQGLKYEEISKVCNTTVSAVKVQVHRALKQLKNFYFKQI
jgi:RNA polymerase sigma factor (sigma-70 family)